MPSLWINNVPPSADTGFNPSFAPRLVAFFMTMFEGVIGSRSACGTKNSAFVVKICKSLPDLIAVIALTVSVAIVTNIASSSKASADFRLKKSFIFDPNKVLGNDLLPPK